MVPLFSTSGEFSRKHTTLGRLDAWWSTQAKNSLWKLSPFHFSSLTFYLLCFHVFPPDRTFPLLSHHRAKGQSFLLARLVGTLYNMPPVTLVKLVQNSMFFCYTALNSVCYKLLLLKIQRSAFPWESSCCFPRKNTLLWALTGRHPIISTSTYYLYLEVELFLVLLFKMRFHSLEKTLCTLDNLLIMCYHRQESNASFVSLDSFPTLVRHCAEWCSNVGKVLYRAFNIKS